MRPWTRQLALTALALLAGPVAAQSPGTPSKLAPPPTFRAEELKLFEGDALQRLGARPTLRTSSLVAGSAPARPIPPAAVPMPPAPATDFVSAETLETEVKSASAGLAAAVKSPTEFRTRGCQTARRELTMLAVCFQAIADQAGRVRWKDQAPRAAVYFLAAADACREPSEAGLRAARDASAQLNELLRGDSVELSAPAGSPPDFAALMQRLEAGHRDRLTPWTASPAEVDEHREAIVHEAEIVRLLARAIAAPGSEYADDAGYRRHAEQLDAAAAAVRQTTEATALSAAVRELGQTCDRCHADFRG